MLQHGRNSPLFLRLTIFAKRWHAQACESTGKRIEKDDPMAIRGLNHITLAVADIDRAIEFYRDVLGLRVAALWETGAYLEAGSLWLCLSVDEATTARADYTHIAFDVDAHDFAAMAERVKAHARVWKENQSEGESLYVLDADGHKLELHVGSLASRLAHYKSLPPKGYSGTQCRG
jgi:catechol 2,3-dioxygenase-like lactoylglutathione lyase family enzyme